MTLRPDQLTESARRLYEDFRGVGLSEAAAVTAATDDAVAEDLLDLQIARVFDSVTRVEAQSRYAKIVEAAAARLRGQAVPTPAGPAQQPVTEAEIDALIRQTFRGA